MILSEVQSILSKGITLYFIRHCSTDWNEDSKLQGTNDISLSLNGTYEAHQIGRRLASRNIQIIFSSNLRRSYQTAEIIQKYCNNSTLHVEKGFREINFGKLEGYTKIQCQTLFSDVWSKWLEKPSQAFFPDGEDLLSFQRRIESTIIKTLGQIAGDTAFVLHGAVLRLIISQLKRLPIDQMNDLKIKNGEILTFNGFL